MQQQSLYERLGGINAIAMVVDRFSDQIVANPKLNVNTKLKDWNTKGQLEGLKFMRTLWICQAAGGPFQYTGKDMHEAHKDYTSPLESSMRSESKLAALSIISA